jgi:hypothetical protein
MLKFCSLVIPGHMCHANVLARTMVALYPFACSQSTHLLSSMEQTGLSQVPSQVLQSSLTESEGWEHRTKRAVSPAAPCQTLRVLYNHCCGHSRGGLAGETLKSALRG